MKKAKQLLFRQGDVALVRIDEIPSDAKVCKVKGDVVLAYGEVTGHAHRLAEGSVKPFAKGGAWDPAAERYIQALDGATLKHEEHNAIALPPGNYRVIQQREYFPDAIRNVAD